MQLYPRHNCLDRETALEMWTHNVTWFSNEEEKKGRIKKGQLADLIVPDRDYFACPEQDISEITSDLTIVGGKVVYGSGVFTSHNHADPPPALPDWSPVRTFGGYGAWRDNRAGKSAAREKIASACGCANACTVHGHDHAAAWSETVPVSDLKSFSGRARLRVLGGLNPMTRAVMRLSMKEISLPPSWFARLFATSPIYWVCLLGLCAAYIQGGLVKATDFNGAVAELAHFGLPPSSWLVLGTIFTELVGSILILEQLLSLAWSIFARWLYSLCNICRQPFLGNSGS